MPTWQLVWGGGDRVTVDAGIMRKVKGFYIFYKEGKVVRRVPWAMLAEKPKLTEQRQDRYKRRQREARKCSPASSTSSEAA